MPTAWCKRSMLTRTSLRLEKGFNQRNPRLGHAHIRGPDAIACFLQKVAISISSRNHC